MASEGTGSEISPQEAADLLHRLITESIKVQAVFTSGMVITTVNGLIRLGPSDTVCVAHGKDPGTPMLVFAPSSAVSRRYGDDRAFSQIPAGPRLSSALVFVMPDKSQVAIFEIA